MTEEQHAMKLAEVVLEKAFDPDDDICVLARQLLRARERNEKLKTVIAWANNSLFGSHNFFLSLNGGADNEHHLDEAIEKLKWKIRDYYHRNVDLEYELNVAAKQVAELTKTQGERA